MDFTGKTLDLNRAELPSEGAGGIHFFAFSSCAGCLHSLAGGFFHLQSQRWWNRPRLWWYFSSSDFAVSIFHTSGPCDGTRPIRIIQNHLFIVKSADWQS